MKIKPLSFGDVKGVTRLYMNLQEDERILFHPFPFNYFIVFLIFTYFAFFNKIYKIIGLIRRYTVLSFICYEHGTIIGLAFISNLKFIDGYKVAGNFGIVVRQEFRGQGVGKNLIKKIIKLCRANGIQKIYLTVMAHNKPAINFYRKLGFEIKELHEKREKWEGKYYPDYTMVMDIKNYRT